MKSLLLALALCAALPAAAQEGRRLAVGGVVGAPTGLSTAGAIGPWFSVALAVGVDSLAERNRYAHLDLLFRPADLTRPGGIDVPLYFGAGVFALEFAGDVFSGLRIPLGVAVELDRIPIQLFLEAAVQIVLVTPYAVRRHADVDLAAGVRVFVF